MFGARRRGASLIEMLVVITLFSIILVSVGFLIRSGHDYYFGSMESLDVQKQALFGISRLSNELIDSNIEAVGTYTAPDGVVFASPRDATGVYQYDEAGRLLWQKYVCYYVDTSGSQSVLARKEAPLPGGAALNPPDPNLEATPHDVIFFQALAAPKTVISPGVTALTPTLLSDALIVEVEASLTGRYEFKLNLQTKIVPRN